MTKPLKYESYFQVDISTEIWDNNLDNYEVIIREYNEDTDDYEKIAARVYIDRISSVYGEGVDFLGVADAQGGGIYEAAIKFFHANENLSKQTNRILSRDEVSIDPEVFFYIDKIEINPEADLSIVPPAIAQALNRLTRGMNPNDWCMAMWEKNSVYINNEPVQNMVLEGSLKNIGLFPVKEKAKKYSDRQLQTIPLSYILNNFKGAVKAGENSFQFQGEKLVVDDDKAIYFNLSTQKSGTGAIQLMSYLVQKEAGLESSYEMQSITEKMAKDLLTKMVQPEETNTLLIGGGYTLNNEKEYLSEPEKNRKMTF